MKIAFYRLFLSLFFIILQSNIYCQVIKGFVFDKSSNNPIENAIVYFNSTFLGTYTDYRGYFELKINKDISLPLTISSLGYYSTTLNDYHQDSLIKVSLTPKIHQLNEITVLAKSNLASRTKNLKLFKEIFLGTSINARKCIIKNEKDIILIRKKDTLYASSREPLHILNESLGYKLDYYLDYFSYTESSGEYFFSGNIIFTDDLINIENKDQLIKKRKNTFLGSKMHFFRSLWENKLDSNGFNLENQAGEKLLFTNLVFQQDPVNDENSPKYLRNIGPIKIFYSPENSISRIRFFSDSITFFKDGNFDGKSVNWEGAMESIRVSSLLPFDYLSNEESQEPIKKYSQEKAWLHIDRDIYNPGDDIWFKAYVVDFITNKPSTGINMLHVDLISPERKILQKRTLRISDGLGNGDFKLNDSLPSGKYYIRAFTNHMRNFSDEFFYNKEIYIIGSAIKSSPLESIQYVQDKINLDFFPEGGSLVDNVVSFVAFKATDPFGKGIDVKGKVFSEKGDLINEFRSTNLGMGVFNIVPKANESYYAFFSGADGKQYKADLPGSFSEGIVLHAFVTKDRRLLLKLLTNDNTLPLYSGQDLHLNISSKDLNSTALTLKINSISNNYSIPLTDSPAGILRLTLTDPAGKPLAERLVFNNETEEVNIRISTDRKTYKLRDPVTANILLSGDSSIKAFASLSAFDSKMFADTTDYGSNIASWFLLESDLRGDIENASSYFDISDDSRLKKLDLLLLTHGWRDFAWKYDSAFQYKPEYGFSLKGKVLKSFQGKPYPGVDISIAIYDQKTVSLLNVTADDQGNFHINNLDFTGKARIIISCRDDKKEFEGYINIDSVSYQSPEFYHISNKKEILQKTKMNDIAETFREIRLTQKKFKLGDTLNIGEVFVTAQRREGSIELDLRSVRAQYGKPDQEFILAPRHRDYIQISQVLVGNIPGVEVNNSRNQSIVTIRGETPLLLIDGIPVGNELRPGGAKLPDLSPSEVDRVDVLYWCSTFGSRGANGVINFITRRGEYSYESNKTAQVNSIYRIGFDQPRIFYSPKHQTNYSEGQTPDFRKTLFWEPNLILNSNKPSELRFYNADEETEILIKIEGITGNGIPIFGSYRYEVKR